MLSQIKKVQLKKQVVIDDRSAPILQTKVSKEEVENYHSSVLNANIENWINLISEFTFKTKFFNLTTKNAELLIEIYKYYKQHLKISEEFSEKLNPIANQLQEVIDSLKGSKPHVFIKSSSRSAKDTAIFNMKFDSIYISKLKSSENNPISNNEKAKYLLETATQLLQVSNAKDMLLEWCTSDRIYEDLVLALEHPEKFNENFVIREWIDIDVDMEFRGFVSNGNLVALSQYNHVCVFPRVIQYKDKIQKLILDTFQKIKPKLIHYSHYIVDFAITGKDLDTVWIIELNPWIFSTDGCLFSWTLDKSILENGPFEFRIREKEDEDLPKKISLEWREKLLYEI
ncbi:cell division cycle protein [Anaeramoeba ignava]|uniref:Cell division cycle protein n=1 Tax=Anaeramoeba ignava TaxID=1746090 RepID=A0A9Q0LX09_ANAIG|nr:cell division cycle protein [Anaeramoeba ignava]